jgi:hypothetical protein
MRRVEARRLRQEGRSIKKIAKEVGAAVSTVSRWTRDIELTEEQRRVLGRRAPPQAHAAAGQASKKIAVARKTAAEEDARKEWPDLCGDPEFLFGLALYIGEGRKGKDGSVALANTDPRILRAAIRFFLRCGPCREQLRVYVQVPEGGHSKERAKVFWSSELNLDRFTGIGTVYRRKKGNKYPYGTCTVRTGNMRVKHKLNVWMDLALD